MLAHEIFSFKLSIGFYVKSNRTSTFATIHNITTTRQRLLEHSDMACQGLESPVNRTNHCDQHAKQDQGSSQHQRPPYHETSARRSDPYTTPTPRSDWCLPGASVVRTLPTVGLPLSRGVSKETLEKENGSLPAANTLTQGNGRGIFLLDIGKSAVWVRCIKKTDPSVTTGARAAWAAQEPSARFPVWSVPFRRYRFILKCAPP